MQAELEPHERASDKPETAQMAMVPKNSRVIEPPSDDERNRQARRREAALARKGARAETKVDPKAPVEGEIQGPNWPGHRFNLPFDTGAPAHKADPAIVAVGHNRGPPFDPALPHKPALSIAELVMLAPRGFGRTKIYQAIQRKELKAKKIGRSTIVMRSDFEEYLRRQPDMA